MTVGVIIVFEGKVLLVKGDVEEGIEETYGLPAGKVEEGESLKAAAVRELFEETGLTVTEDGLEKMPTEYEAQIDRKGDSVLMHLTVFKCLDFKGGILFMFGEETTPEWVEIDNVANLKLLPNVDKIIKEFLDTANN